MIRLTDRIHAIAKWLAALALLTMMVLTFTDVNLRYRLGQPILGSNEMTEFLLGAVVFSGLVIVTGERSHIVVTRFGLSVVPLFILMGTLIQRANISDELYDAGYAWVGKYKGGLAMATVLSCAGFSAVSGSSLATAATMSRVAMPPMRRYRYEDSLASGTLAAGGTLGIMIPPSVPMIIYGIVTETNIGFLFIAGIVPGLLLTLAYLGAVRVRVTMNPALGPPGEPVDRREKWRTLYKIWPILVLFFLVLGGIYLSVFTPTEAGAVGCVGAFAFALSRGRMWNIREIVEVAADAAVITARIFIIGGAALIFGQFLNFADLVVLALIFLIPGLAIFLPSVMPSF